jgi:KUP system potassium uptake protein
MTNETQSPEVPAQADHSGKNHHKSRLLTLVFGSVGVVYGDIGTSPLYALRESLHAASANGLRPDEVFGVISLLVWTLILIVTVKYVILVMRADNKGEGGTLSILALLQQALNRRPVLLLAVGVIGISLFFGDAMITPAMSVLSAVEGLKLVAPQFETYVIPLTIAIILALFLVQAQGTQRVSTLFGPIMLAWFAVMALMGAVHIADDVRIFAALNPLYAARYLVENGQGSLIVLGSVFLAVTGGEALYADMGHFGRKPIRIAWTFIVFPALTLSYLGQGALVLSRPETAGDPFFLMAPEWALLPLVILAMMATVIASQAVISGAFSMMQQAVQMGLLPRMEIRYTSQTQQGQIYLPKVNAVLMIGVLLLVVSFGSSSRLASAYGIAVSGDMVITSILAFALLYKAWKWPLLSVAVVMLPILGIEVMFLAANMLKFPDGGYVPIAIAMTMCIFIWTWLRGTAHVAKKSADGAISLTKLIKMLEKSEPTEVPGTAVYLTQDPTIAPSALLHNLKHNRVLHAKNFVVTVLVTNDPIVADEDRLTLNHLTDHFVQITMRFGYMETPNVPRALALARKRGEKFDIMTTSFFLNRRSFKSSRNHGLPLWQERIFISMTKSASDATAFYCLPSNRVIELGQQMTI